MNLAWLPPPSLKLTDPAILNVGRVGGLVASADFWFRQPCLEPDPGSPAGSTAGRWQSARPVEQGSD